MNKKIAVILVVIVACILSGCVQPSRNSDAAVQHDPYGSDGELKHCCYIKYHDKDTGTAMVAVFYSLPVSWHREGNNIEVCDEHICEWYDDVVQYNLNSIKEI